MIDVLHNIRRPIDIPLSISYREGNGNGLLVIGKILWMEKYA